MIKKSRKIISIVLALMMVISCFAVLNVSAATTDEVVSSALASVYQTNPNGAKGKNASITIDGSFSDWTADMKIAQSGAWDVANNWKGAHENCVLDTTGLYAAWDNQNLYVAWQMVNITDTFWREGDGPLSDGGRVLDVPLILALSVDPSSTSLNNQVVGESKKIWGVDIEFDTHVDHLFYMSGKPGLGTPAMFTVADNATGATNYTSACQNFSAAGIKYALAEGNIESKIMGLDGSQSKDDVKSDDSNWVDFKTHQGSEGVHNTKYDSFYEMSIPLSALGIDANYLANNGIGAMIVASRGESGLDCTPYDLCMIDNAEKEYGADSSTSHEKDDSDVITSAFARIGATGGNQPQPPQPPQPPEPPEPEPPTPDSLMVDVTSNLSNVVTETYNAADNTVTVTANLESSNRIVDGEIYIKYDPTKLKIAASNYDEGGNPVITPTISGVGGEIINMAYDDNTICITFTSTKKYDFTTSKPLVQITFDKIGTGNTNINFNIEELDCAESGSNTPVILVKDGVPNALYNSTCKTTFSLSKSNGGSDDNETLDVNVTSNIANSVSNVYNDSDTVTVTYNLESSNRIVDGEIYIKYDPTKLKIAASNYDEGGNPVITPTVSQVGGELVNMTYDEDTICVTFTNTKKYNFTTSKPLIQITFDIIGTGNTTVDFNVAELDCVESGSEVPVILVKSGVPNALYNSTCKAEIVLSKSTVDVVGENDVKVVAKSNIATKQSEVYSTIKNKQVTVTYMLKSDKMLNAAEWRLTYDPKVLKFADVNYDSNKNVAVMPVADKTNASGVVVANLPEEGRLRGTFASSNNCYDFTKEGKFVEVTFDIIGKGVATDVNLTVDILSYYNLNTDVTMVKDGKITSDYSASAYIKLSNPKQDGPNPYLGDANEDGEINIKDATLVQEHVAKLSTLTDQAAINADVNLSNDINITDATNIQMYAAKYISDFSQA